MSQSRGSKSLLRRNRKGKPAKETRTSDKGKDAIAAARANRLYSSVSSACNEVGVPEVQEPSLKVLHGIDPNFSKHDFSKVSTQIISRYHQYASGMLSYVVTCAAVNDNEVAAHKGKFLRLQAELRITYDSGQPKYILDAKVEENSTLKSVKQLLEVAEAKARLLKAQVEVYQTRVNMLSRELTRRTAEMNSNVR